MIIGDKLTKLLQKNKSNIVANKLLSLSTEEANWEFEVDYIDIAISNSNRISYITKDRLSRFIEILECTDGKLPIGYKGISLSEDSDHYDQQVGLGTIISYYGGENYVYRIEWENGSTYCYRKSDIENHPAILDTLPDCKVEMPHYQDERYREKYAYMTSPGKFIKKLNLDFSDKEIQEFFSIFLRDDVALITEGVRFELVSGNLIKDYYLGDNYASESGNLGNSCMRHSNTQEYVAIYSKFPDKIHMLTLLTNEGNKVAGRAIVWTCFNAEDNSEITFMDRIYVNNSNHEEFFKFYAQKHGWWYKTYQTYSNPDEFMVPCNGYTDSVEKEITICLDIDGDEYFPYLDTFASGDFDGNELELHNSDSCDLDFHDTEGGPFVKANKVHSSYYDTDLNEDDAVYSEELDDYIVSCDAVTVITRISGSREYTSYMPDDHDDIVEINGTWYLKELCTWSEYYGEYIFGDNIVSINDGDDYVYIEDTYYCEYKDGDYLKGDCVYSDYESDYILKEEAVEDEIEGWVLESSLDDILEARKEKEY